MRRIRALALPVLFLSACDRPTGTRTDPHLAIVAESLTLWVGQDTTLRADWSDPKDPTRPPPHMEWTSSDPSVVYVRDAFIRALRPGTARIQVQAGEISDTARVTVRRTPNEIVLRSPVPYALPGDTVRIKVSVYDTDDQPMEIPLTWSSSDTTVATIDSTGLLFARRPGSTQIHASSGPFFSVLDVSVRTSAVSDRCTRANALPLSPGEVRTFTGAAGYSVCLSNDEVFPSGYTLVVYNPSMTDTLVLHASSLGDIAAFDVAPALDRRARPPLPARLHRDLSFERVLRRRERTELQSKPFLADRPRPQLLRDVAPQAVRVGDLLRFNVSTTCDTAHADYRTGSVVAISRRAILVADTANPADGPSAADYQGYAATFDTLTYAVDTGAFGEPTDIDGNGRIVIFYTRAVNELTPPRSFTYVGGFFWAGDLFPAAGCAASNQGEMFYMMAGDPHGVVNGNVRTKALIERVTAGVIAHEFQHLINASRRIYVNHASSLEDSWLDEGLSHIAEELVFYRAAGYAPRRNLRYFDVQNTLSSIESAFDSYMSSNIARLEEDFRYFDQHTAFDDDVTIETRGAIWSFLRYAADRVGGDESAFWHRLANSTTHGRANLDAALGASTVDWSYDAAIATIRDDFHPPIDLRYQHPSWDFHALMAGLYGVFPLQVYRLTSSQSAHLRLAPGAAAYLGAGTLSGGLSEVRVEYDDALSGPSFSVAVVRGQ